MTALFQTMPIAVIKFITEDHSVFVPEDEVTSFFSQVEKMKGFFFVSGDSMGSSQ
jgi:hypothetical protein